MTAALLLQEVQVATETVAVLVVPGQLTLWLCCLLQSLTLWAHPSPVQDRAHRSH